MTELEQKIIEHAQTCIHRLHYWDKVHLNRILSKPAEAELTNDERMHLEHLGKAFGLVPLTPQEADAERRNRMKRHPSPGPLKPSSRRRRRF